MSYFIYTNSISSFLIQDALILNQLWAMLVYTGS